MRHTNLLSFIILFVFTCAAPALRAEVTVDFEDLSLPPESFYNGADNAGGFTSRDVQFNNDFTDFGSFTVWSGFAYSNRSDTTTPGFNNQYSAITGAGASGSENYAIGFTSTRITFPVPTTVRNAAFTNTTYAALSMQNGDAFAKQFGGPTGDDADYFTLTITSLDDNDDPIASLDLDLADFRSDINADDFILNTWQTVDLTSLGDNVKALTFSYASSDVGPFGINTPTYFALDNLTVAAVPQPATLAGFAGLFAALWTRRRSLAK